MLPSIFHTSLWFTPESQRNEENPAEFLIRTFPYHYLSTFKLSSEIAKLEGVYTGTIERTILEHCVVDFRNVVDASGRILTVNETLKILPVSIINELLIFIFSIAMYDDKFISTLKSSLHVHMDPRFSDESWKCTTCQKRRLDRQRNCPYLPKEEHDSHITYPTMDGVVTECPVGKVDFIVTNNAIEAFNYRTNGMLPEDGGIRNQTVFFMLASQEVENIRNYFQEKERKKAES